MKFEEVLPHLRKGGRIRRKSWTNKACYIAIIEDVETLLVYDYEECIDKVFYIDPEDLLAHDWEHEVR